MLELILLTFLILLLGGTLPLWPHGRPWGAGPFVAVMLVFVIVFVLSVIRLL
ncbi:MAG: DUF3309 family protein [Planctomycetes bacterium]|nr:DUF3309 family protein [Planctomycetota bacterium]